MTSPHQIQPAPERRQRRRRMTLLSAAGLFLVVALALSLLVASSGGSKDPQPPSGVVPPSPLDPASPTPNQQGWVRLPAATAQADGFPVGFPRSPQGAAAAMASMLQATWTLNAWQARRASAVYAHPAARDAAVEGGAQSTRDFRADLGLPLEGDVPAGAYLSVTTVATRWRAVSADEVRVAMMVRIDSGLDAQMTPRSKTVSMGGIWVWDRSVRGGDWVFTAGDANDVVPELAAPGTPQFAAAGWLAIVQQEGHP